MKYVVESGLNAMIYTLVSIMIGSGITCLMGDTYTTRSSQMPKISKVGSKVITD
jgi:hypothetical protein